MILLMDVGNTNIKIGLANDKKTVKFWRIATDTTRTADEFGMTLLDLLAVNNYKFSDVEGIIISSVVPSINYTLEHMCSYYFKCKPIMVGQNINTCIKIDYANGLGGDRIVNAVAAYENYGGPIIIVDCGTATTFGMVNAEGVFVGGMIAPGIKASMESFARTAAKLPRIELVKPENVVGKDTISNMQSGLIYGFTGLTSYIVNQIKQQPGFAGAKVVATGGMSQLITQIDDKFIDIIDRALSLKGLLILYKLNTKGDIQCEK
ncbi:MAG: type III pantothenate kinase [Clostridia bacterium]